MENQASAIRAGISLFYVVGVFMSFVGGSAIGLSIPVQQPLMMGAGAVALTMAWLFLREIRVFWVANHAD